MNNFAQFTDAQRMKHVFAQYLWASERERWQITECHIRHVWRKTYRKHPDHSFITVLYELQLADRHTGESRRQMLYAKAYQQNRSQRIFQQHVNDRLSAPPVGSAFSHLPALDMVVWAFPNDPAMPQLAALTKPEQAKAYLPLNNVVALNIEIINYRPELRCTARYELTCETNGQHQQHILFGKTFATPQAEEVFTRMQAMWNWAATQPTAFRIAQPLSFHSATNMIWQEGLHGTPLVQMLEGANCQPIAYSIAKGLINLHASKIPVSNTLTPDTHLAEASKKAAKLGQAFPHLQATLKMLCTQLVYDRPRNAPLGLIHGDFHVKQLLWCDGNIALFDFDEFALGDPMQDVANFIADLYAHSLDTTLIEALTAVLCEAYRQQSPQAYSPQRLHWHMRVQLLTRAYRCLWQQRPELERAIHFYLQLAQGGVTPLAQAA